MIEFGVLGPLIVHRSAGPVAVPGGIPHRLLALLLSQRGHAVATDVIADQLWQGQPPRTARKSIQVSVHHLRRILDSERRIRSTIAGYAVKVGPAECDALAFHDLVASATAAADTGNWMRADDLFTQAIGLWRGPAFADVEGVSMVDRERTRLSDLRLTAFETHIRAGLELGRHQTLIPELREAIAGHPFHEVLYEQLMLALYRSGRTAEALEVYRDARDQMVRELGMEPGDKLRLLHRQILQGDPGLSGKEAVAGPKRDFLPRDVPGFTGRAMELAWLDEVAKGRSPTAVISAIAGMAGVGKSALMVRWAQQSSHRFPGGQLYVNLRAYGHGLPPTTIQALHHLLICLGVPRQQLPGSLDDAVARYRATLAGKRTLILIDDARTADQVRPLLPGEPGCVVLVTSRNSMTGLIALDGAQRLTLGPLPEADAVALLRHLLDDARIDADPDAAVGLASVCGRLPLALRIAAAHLADRPRLTVDAYLSELSAASPAQALAIEGDEHHGVAAVFGKSFEALGPPARHVFQLLSLVPGPDFTPDVVAELADISPVESGKILDHLAAAHLVTEKQRGRFTLHDLLRDYSGQLAQAGGQSAHEPVDRLMALLRHVTWKAYAVVRPGFAAAPDGHDHDPRPGVYVPATQQEAAAWLEAEYTNIAAAIAAAAAYGPHDHVRALVDPLWQLCYAHGRVGDWINTFEGVVAAMRRAGEDVAMLDVLNTLGNAYVLAGRYEQAAEAHRTCASAWKLCGRDIDESRARTNLAASLDRLGHSTEALEELTVALATFQREGLSAQQAYVLGAMAGIERRLGHFVAARDHLRRAVDILWPSGPTLDLARALNMLAEVYVHMGSLAEALEHVQEAITIAQESGNRYIQTMAKTTLASILRGLGQLEESLRLALEADETLSELGMPPVQAENQIEIAMTYVAMGDDELALSSYRRALTLAAEVGDQHLMARARAGIGDCADSRVEQTITGP